MDYSNINKVARSYFKTQGSAKFDGCVSGALEKLMENFKKDKEAQGNDVGLDKTKANIVYLLWDECASGSGITKKSSGHVHALQVYFDKMDGDEWLVNGSATISDDDETPHDHPVYMRISMVEDEGKKITISTLDANRGASHTHDITLKWKKNN